MSSTRGDSPPDKSSERCTCLTMTDLAQMQARNEVVQSRYPCPVHPEPEFPPGTFVPRIPIAWADPESREQSP